MKFKSTQNILGMLLMMFSVAQLIPSFIAYIYKEELIISFLTTFLVTFLSGLILFNWPSAQTKELRTKDGFIITIFFWTVLAIFGSFPFFLANIEGITYIDSLFESISGLTTTGATVLTGLDSLPKSVLFYRQFLQWLGGMGIIVLAVAVLPLLGIGGMQLYKAETPGPLKGSKLTPRITETAKALWYVYLSMTVVCALFYKYFGMNTFDAICHAFSTVAIGGFSTHDESFAYFSSDGITYTAIVFMLLAGINFALHFTAWSKARVNHYLKDSEVRFYLSIILIAFFITFITLSIYQSPYEATSFKDTLFQVISIATTTGFMSAKYADWPLFIPFMLLFVAFVGACAGSTGGGIKAIRALVLIKQGIGEFIKLIHPNAVISIKLSNRPLNRRVAESVWGFFSMYVLVFIVIMMFLLAQGNDFTTSFSAVAASINNLGPGLGQVAENYHSLNAYSKLGLCFAMLLGRLEIFTLLIVFSPSFWRS